MSDKEIAMQLTKQAIESGLIPKEPSGPTSKAERAAEEVANFFKIVLKAITTE